MSGMNKTENAKKDKLGSIILIIGCTLWGLSGTCGQFLFSEKGIQSGWMVMVRMTVSGIILLAYCILTKNKSLTEIWKNKKDALRLIIFTFCGFLVSQYSYLTAIYYSSAGTATVLQEVGPAIIVFVVCIQTKKLPTKKQLLCVALALGGTFLVATKGDPGSWALSPKGLFWGLMSAVGIVLYSMTAGDLTVKYGNIPVVGYALLIGGIVFGLLSGNFRQAVVIDSSMILPIFGVVILGTTFAYTMYIMGVTMCGPIKASMIGTIEPVAATVFSYFWLKTEVTVVDIIGSAMILSIVFILNINFGKKTE